MVLPCSPATPLKSNPNPPTRPPVVRPLNLGSHSKVLNSSVVMVGNLLWCNMLTSCLFRLSPFFVLQAGLCGIAMQPSYPLKSNPNPPTPPPGPKPGPKPPSPPKPEPVQGDSNSECPPSTTCCCLRSVRFVSVVEADPYVFTASLLLHDRSDRRVIVIEGRVVSQCSATTASAHQQQLRVKLQALLSSATTQQQMLCCDRLALQACGTHTRIC